MLRKTRAYNFLCKIVLIQIDWTDFIYFDEKNQSLEVKHAWQWTSDPVAAFAMMVQSTPLFKIEQHSRLYLNFSIFHIGDRVRFTYLKTCLQRIISISIIICTEIAVYLTSPARPNSHRRRWMERRGCQDQQQQLLSLSSYQEAKNSVSASLTFGIFWREKWGRNS